MFEDAETRLKLWRDIRRTKRGRTLSVSGAVANHWTQTVGKLLVHQMLWEAFFEDGHGIVRIGDDRRETLNMTRPNEIPNVKRATVQQGDAYLARRAKQLPLRLKIKAPKPPTAGAPLGGLG